MDAKYWLKNDFEEMTRIILNVSKDRLCEDADWWKERCAQRRKVSLEMSIDVGHVFLVR